MSKKVTLILIITGLFIVIAGGFEFMHMRADIEPVEVDSEVLKSFDPTLNTNFADDLKVRQENESGPDLGY